MGYTRPGATKLGRPTKLQQITPSPEQELASLVQYSATTSLVTLPINRWSSVLSGCGAPDQGSGQTCDAAEGAKNLWFQTGRHWKLNLATFNMRTLSSEASLARLFEELSGIAWGIIRLSEVRRAGEAYAELNNGHVLCYSGLPDKKEFGVGFLVHMDIAGNFDEFYSINESVSVVL